MSKEKAAGSLGSTVGGKQQYIRNVLQGHTGGRVPLALLFLEDFDSISFIYKLHSHMAF